MELRTTADGSATLYSSLFNETYHSINGAITESNHVFIDTGLKHNASTPLHLLEIGFGTGLNALLTYIEAERNQRLIYYHSIEKFPVPNEIYQNYPFPENFSPETKAHFFLSYASLQ